MAYPDTTLGTDSLDPEFGGQPANNFGLPAWQWINAVARFLSQAYLAYLRVTWSGIVVQPQSAVAAGDVVVLVAGVAPAGMPFIAQRYAASLSNAVQLGIAMESQSALTATRIATHGVIPPTITGLGTQATAVAAGIDPSAGRVRVAQPGDTAIGMIDLAGNLVLTGYGQVTP